MAVIMYAADYNDHAPNRNNWCDHIGEYVRYKDLHKCTVLIEGPEDVYGLAFSSNLSNFDFAKIPAPAQKPMVYDSLNLAWNASDPFTSLPNPGRHRTVNNISFVDGHAKSFRPDRSALLKG